MLLKILDQYPPTKLGPRQVSSGDLSQGPSMLKGGSAQAHPACSMVNLAASGLCALSRRTLSAETAGLQVERVEWNPGPGSPPTKQMPGQNGTSGGRLVTESEGIQIGVLWVGLVGWLTLVIS